MSRRQSAHKGQGTAKRRRRRLTVLSGDARVIAKVWRLQPLYVILLAAHALLWGFVDTLAVYYRTALFNAMDSDVPFWNAARWIVYIAVFYVLLFIPDFLYNLILKPILERRLSTRMRRNATHSGDGKPTLIGCTPSRLMPRSCARGRCQP